MEGRHSKDSRVDITGKVEDRVRSRSIIDDKYCSEEEKKKRFVLTRERSALGYVEETIIKQRLILS